MHMTCQYSLCLHNMQHVLHRTQQLTKGCPVTQLLNVLSDILVDCVEKGDNSKSLPAKLSLNICAYDLLMRFVSAQHAACLVNADSRIPCVSAVESSVRHASVCSEKRDSLKSLLTKQLLL